MEFPWAKETIGDNIGLYGEDTSVLNSFVHNLARKMGVSPEEAFLKFPMKLGTGDEFLGRHFQDHYQGPDPAQRGGTVLRTDLGSGQDWQGVGITQAATPETLGHESAHAYDYLLAKWNPDGTFTERTKVPVSYSLEKDPTKRWMKYPKGYDQEMHDSITGYGIRNEYELKAMQDSWDRAARSWTPEQVMGAAKPANVSADKSLPENMRSINREVMFNQSKHNRMKEAVRSKWLDDPANDKYGDLRGALSSTVSNAMVNQEYDNAVNTMRDKALRLRRTASELGQNPETPLLLQLEKDRGYFNSPSERWARYFGKSLDDVNFNNLYGSGSQPDADEVVKNLNKLLFK